MSEGLAWRTFRLGTASFYPERSDLVQEAQQLAAMLGGRLEIPKLSWNYFWIQKLFGLIVAKRARLFYNQWKTSLLTSWDKALFELERRSDSLLRSTQKP